MTRRVFLACLLPASAAIGAPWDELLRSGRRLLEENLDPTVVKALQSGEVADWEGFLRQASTRLQGDYVLDLASLQEAVQLAIPLLEGRPETRGYAAWLRTRADYFDVADFFRDRSPVPRPSPGRPTPPPINPTPEQERQTWKSRIESQPAPKGAASLVPKLKPVFRSAGAPPELVWLAEVESSFDPQARSPVGAVGLYQLMPETAKELGLKVSPTDDRLVPEKNARAAATYLGRLRRQFADWRLALAAYNAGPGRVAGIQKRRRATSFDAIAPDLPAETQMYVPKFEAVLQRREKRSLTTLKA